MTTLQEQGLQFGTPLDWAFAGNRPGATSPISMAFEGFFIPVESSLPPPECWDRFVISSDENLLVSVGADANQQVLLVGESNLLISVGELTSTISLEDEVPIKARIPCQ